jgi:hypothetical protein
MIVASFFAPRYEKYEGVDYDELLYLLDKSCKKLDFKHLVISDEPRPKPLNTFLCPLPEELMQAILCGQMMLLAESKEPVLLTGADCLLTRDPRPFFQGDLAITTSKTFSDCVMNTGAIFVKHPNLCFDIWQKALDKNPVEWGDDQTCLYEIIKESKFDVKEIACEEHNWAPNDLDDDANLATIVHFRGGKRKKFMKDWAKKYLNID